jgi:uncharacterized protein (AIM24 family)
MNLTVQGGYVPNVLAELGPGEEVFCEAGVMVYCDPSINFRMRPLLQGGLGQTMKRTLVGGIPFYMHTFTGPGYAAFSRFGPGEVRILELGPGQSIDVAEHSLLLASQHIQYDCFWVPGRGGLGRLSGFWMDRLTGPGTVAIHGHGNILSFTLAPNETFDIDHGGILMKDPSVAMEAFFQHLGGGLAGGALAYSALRTRGPGRLFLQTLDPSLPRR